MVCFAELCSACVVGDFFTSAWAFVCATPIGNRSAQAMPPNRNMDAFRIISTLISKFYLCILRGLICAQMKHTPLAMCGETTARCIYRDSLAAKARGGPPINLILWHLFVPLPLPHDVRQDRTNRIASGQGRR